MIRYFASISNKSIVPLYSFKYESQNNDIYPYYIIKLIQHIFKVDLHSVVILKV